MSISPSFARNIAAFVILALVSIAPARAEVAKPMVTGLSNGHVGSYIEAGVEKSLYLRLELGAGRLSVNDSQQLMLYCWAMSGDSPSGGVILVVGPAEVEIAENENDLTLKLKSGRIMAMADCDQSDQLVILEAADAQGTHTIKFPIGRGQTTLSKDPNGIDIAFLSTTDASLRVAIDGQNREIPSDKRLTIQPGATNESDAAAWLNENDLDMTRSVDVLSVKSARASRIAVQSELTDSVVGWDKFAQAENIEPEESANKVRAEIRQVVSAVQNNVQNTTNRGASPQTPPVQGANQVPTLSPAAVSVGGVTAVNSNNQNAGNLNNRTGSRGLGFNGPAQLSTPGILGGRRFFGPPGLGAQKPIKR